MISLDAIDRRILDRLQKDGRLSNAELAEQVGLSASPCWRRVKALEEAVAWTNADKRRAAKLYIAMTKEKKLTEDDIVATISSDGFDFTTTPKKIADMQKQIDQVLTDREKGEAFRKEVKSGFDSLDVMDKYFPAELKDKLDACRYEAGEYLTRRGFPPGH